MSSLKEGEWEPTKFYAKIFRMFPSWNFVCEENSGESDVKELVISLRSWNPGLSSFGVSSVMFSKYNKKKEDEWNTHYSEGVWNLTKDGEIQIYNLYSVGHRGEEKGYCDPHFLDMQVMHINPPELNEKENEDICVEWTDKKFFVEKGEFTSNHPMVEGFHDIKRRIEFPNVKDLKENKWISCEYCDLLHHRVKRDSEVVSSTKAKL